MGSHAMLNLGNKQAAERERALANGIKEVVAELRLVDVVDYIAFLRMDCLGNIADIVESSAQLFLKPGSLRFADGGDIHLVWGGVPAIDLDMEFRNGGVSVHFRLSLAATSASVHITFIAFADPNDDPPANTRRLLEAIDDARLAGPLPR